MRLGRKKVKDLLPSHESDANLYFRLCHHCLHLNESGGEILQCEKCQRYLTVEPFIDEKARQRKARRAMREEEAADLEDPFLESLGDLPPDRPRGLAGLAVVW